MFYLWEGFGKILYFSVLLINAIAVLNEERFLSRVGLSTVQPPNPYDQGFGEPGGPTVRQKLVTLIVAVRTLMRVPLIGINILIIVWELLMG